MDADIVTKQGSTGTRAARVEELYRARLGAFVRVAAAITGDRESARDAVHDAFAASLRDLPPFRGEAALEAAATPAPRPDPEIRTMVAALPERQRLMLFLRYFADLDYATIGAVAGVSTGTVSATLSAAHAALRAALQTGRQQ
jgi:DNA-directed RNA polymerase specialized sigma24 family protein